MHIFEQTGLGKAPFRFIGIERKIYQACTDAPIQPGASCNYCHTGIIECCIIQDTEGKRFIVGNVCVNKTGDKGLINPVKRELNRLRSKMKKEKDKERISKAKEDFPLVSDMISMLPHPNKWMTDNGKNLSDYAEWLFSNSGNTGKIRACRIVESF